MGRAYDRNEYRRNARKAKERDGWQCRACGRHFTVLPNGKRDITAQHIHPSAAGGSDAVSNLISICRYCHGRQDGGRRYAR